MTSPALKRGSRFAARFLLALIVTAAGLTLHSSLASAAASDHCWDVAMRKVEEAKQKHDQGDLASAQQAALSAYAWSRGSASLPAAQSLLWVLRNRGHELAAAAVACDVDTEIPESDPDLSRIQREASALCKEAVDRLGVEVQLDLSDMRGCEREPRWDIEVTLGDRPIAVRSYDEVRRLETQGLLVVQLKPTWPPQPAVASPELTRSEPTARRSHPSKPVDGSITWFCGGPLAYPCSLGVVGLLALGGAGILGYEANQRERNADDICPARNGCATARRASSANDELKRAKRLAMASDLSLLGGGAMIALSLAWYLMTPTAHASDAGTSPVNVACSGEGCWLWAGAHF